jgi:hypothetical protein
MQSILPAMRVPSVFYFFLRPVQGIVGVVEEMAVLTALALAVTMVIKVHFPALSPPRQGSILPQSKKRSN